ncbi:hypothetical protein IDVR_18430 [Intrasporangium sp. DVR]
MGTFTDADLYHPRLFAERDLAVLESRLPDCPASWSELTS